MSAQTSDTSLNAVLAELGSTIESRKGADPGESYVASLFDAGRDQILKKVGEEATETILAAASGDREHVVRETADLWFHTLVMLAELDLSADDVIAELARREGISGHDEKAARKNDTWRT